MKVFLCGSKTVTSLPPRFTYLLDCCCRDGCDFLIGDCFGADRLMQEYLFEHEYMRVTVYVSGQRIRNRIGNYPVRHIPIPDGMTGFEFYRQKDLAMIEDCDTALILWDGKTKGTFSNALDLTNADKPFSLILSEWVL